MTMNERNRQDEPRGGPFGPGGVSRRAFIQGAAGAGAAAAVAGAAGWLVTGGADEFETEPPKNRIVARRASGSVPRDPGDATWRSLTSLAVPMLAQNMTTPRVKAPTIQTIALRSLHNGSEIGFHLEWADKAVDDIEAIARFRDSVAVELPVDPDRPTSVMMGQIGRPVHILHWRASWQSEMESGSRSVQRAFPNAVNEVTPEAVLGEEASRVYYPALYVGNLMASRKRTTPVEELIAEGFGTLTAQEDQRAEGRGVQSNGLWSVVIVVPISGSANQVSLKPGGMTRVALAAWDGGAGNRGARKQWSNWISLELES